MLGDQAEGFGVCIQGTAHLHFAPPLPQWPWVPILRLLTPKQHEAVTRELVVLKRQSDFPRRVVNPAQCKRKVSSLL